MKNFSNSLLLQKNVQSAFYVYHHYLHNSMSLLLLSLLTLSLISVLLILTPISLLLFLTLVVGPLLMIDVVLCEELHSFVSGTLSVID